MRLVTYNIHFGVGRDGELDLERIAAAVDGADVIGLNEVECFWPRSGMVHQPEALARLLPSYHWVYGPYLDVDASDVSEDGHVTNRRRQHGNMLLSRYPILNARNHVLPKFDGLSHFSMSGGAIEGVIEPPGGALRVYAVHLGSLTTEERQAQLRALLDARDRARLEGGEWTGSPFGGGGVDWSCGDPPPPNPHDAVMMGDFNAVPGSPEHRTMIAATPGAKGPVRFRHGFTDAWAAVHGEAGDETIIRESTNYRGDEVRVDYIFVANALAERIKGARVDRDAAGSDHQPVWVDLSA